MADNRETAPDLIIARARSGRDQVRLNIELALSQKKTVGGGASASASASPSGGVLQQIVGGEIGPGGGGGGGLCFSGDTLFTLSDGVRIPFTELFEKYHGHYAWSFNEKKERVKGKILDVMKSVAHSYLEATFADGSIDKVKPRHRYLTSNGEYGEIKDLLGKLVVYGTGVEMLVTGLQLRWSEEGIEMFNASIETYQNYCANGKIVHNAKPRGDDF